MADERPSSRRVNLAIGSVPGAGDSGGALLSSPLTRSCWVSIPIRRAEQLLPARADRPDLRAAGYRLAGQNLLL